MVKGSPRLNNIVNISLITLCYSYIYINLFNGCSASIRHNITPLESKQEICTEDVWTWECQDVGCRKVLINDVKNDKEEEITRSKTNETRTLLSEEVCHLMCPPGNLWPQPTGKVYISPSYVYVNAYSISVNIHPQNTKTEFVDNVKFNTTEATEIFLKRFKNFGRKAKRVTTAKDMEINLLIMMPNIYKYETGVDESYSLFLNADKNNLVNVTIVGETFLGVRHGLETLSQLFVFDSITSSIVTPSEVTITDKPVYSYRGIAIDTARNYISVPSLLRTLDAMSFVKLNTLHWHITDSQSFPFVSKSYPLFSKYGAYSPEKVYTEEDIHQIVDYAQLRGIRVIPELDLPSHVGEGWQAVPGAVVCFNSQPWTTYCVEPPCGIVDPTSEIVYDVLKGLYSDLNRAFDSDLFHMGGDEVNFYCWNTTDVIIKNMEKNGINRNDDGFHKLWSDFQSKAKQVLQANGGKDKQFILWTSSLTEGDLDKYLNNSEYIIQVWTKGDDPAITNILKKGFRIIMSNYDALYFDCGFGAWVGSGNNWCSPYIPWQKVYENTDNVLKKLGLNKELSKLVLGSEATLWTEQADDSSIDNRLWPRGAALAESLWAPGLPWLMAENRYVLQRERFVQNGIAADTVKPEWCKQNEGFCYQ